MQDAMCALSENEINEVSGGLVPMIAFVVVILWNGFPVNL